MTQPIRIGTRGSQLALWQANWVKSRIESLFPDRPVEIVIIKTKGDRITDRPLSLVGGKGLFVKEIETQLLDRDIDIAVHSMKDMPGELPGGLTIGAVPRRENPFDVLISNGNIKLADYPSGTTVGTSSLRRAAQIRHLRPDLVVAPIRGNLDTRLKKLRSRKFDAIILAAAGLIRLGQADCITETLDETQMIPAAGQGALCIETRSDDSTTAEIMAEINHDQTAVCVSGERAFLARLGGSCHIPVACFGQLDGPYLILKGLVASEDGTRIISEQVQGPADQAVTLGAGLADTLLARGGKTILETLSPHE